MFTRFFCWFRDFCWTPEPKPWEPRDPNEGIQVFGGDGEDDNPFKDWPKGWRHDRSRARGIAGCVRCDGLRLGTDAGIWIVLPNGNCRSGHDPQEGPVNVIKVMEFANEVYPIGTTEYPPNKFDKMWDDLKAK